MLQNVRAGSESEVAYEELLVTEDEGDERAEEAQQTMNAAEEQKAAAGGAAGDPAAARARVAGGRDPRTTFVAAVSALLITFWLVLRWWGREETEEKLHELVTKKALAVCSVKVLSKCSNIAPSGRSTQLLLGQFTTLAECQAACYEQKRCLTFTYKIHLSSFFPFLENPPKDEGYCWGQLDGTWAPTHLLGAVCGKLPTMHTKDSEEHLFASRRRPCVKPKIFFENYGNRDCRNTMDDPVKPKTVSAANLHECQQRCTQLSCQCATFERGKKMCTLQHSCDPTFCHESPQDLTLSVKLNQRSSQLDDLKSIMFPDLAVPSLGTGDGGH